jgi:hypothetical protein
MIDPKELYAEKLPSLAGSTFEILLRVDEYPDEILPWWWQEVKFMLLKNTKYWPQWAFGRNELRKSYASSFWDWDFIHELTVEVLYDQLVNKRQLRIWILPEVEDIEQIRSKLWLVCRNVLSKHRKPTINSNTRRRMVDIFKSMGIKVGKDPIALPKRSFTPDQIDALVKIAKRKQAEVEELFDLLGDQDKKESPDLQPPPPTLASNEEDENLDQEIEALESLEESEKRQIAEVAMHFADLEQHHQSQERKLSYIFDSQDLVEAAIAMVESGATVSVRILEWGVDAVLNGVAGSLTSLKATFMPFDPLIGLESGAGESTEGNVLTNISTVESYEGMQRSGGGFPTIPGGRERGKSRAAEMSNKGLDDISYIRDPQVTKLARKVLSNLDHKEQKCFALEIPGLEITQVEKLERIGGLPGKPYRQKYGDYAKKLLMVTIPNLFEEIPVPTEVHNDVVKEMWVQLGVQSE